MKVGVGPCQEEVAEDALEVVGACLAGLAELPLFIKSSKKRAARPVSDARVALEIHGSPVARRAVASCWSGLASGFPPPSGTVIPGSCAK